MRIDLIQKILYTWHVQMFHRMSIQNMLYYW